MICNSVRRIASRGVAAAAPSSSFTRAASSTASTSIAASTSAPTTLTSSPPEASSTPESSSAALTKPSSSSSSAASMQRYTPRYLSAGTKPAPKQAISSLRALRASLFGQTHNPQNLRTGAKFLRKPLVGPGMLSYYPPEIKLSEVRSWLLDPIRLGRLSPEQRMASALVSTRMKYTLDELQRLEDVARRKALGKGPPKKGQGRRAAMKNKTGKK
ncbi:mitochondral 37S ribosomal protein S27 [Tilletia horrida]|uniref:Small ribosomal subunit protein mS33 n=1 Tax=Tilletia horrida TaxID=155126 RepID=A0AAN6JVQ6_9BASI|nr:mitochondral 37S ribosomal protein S27 [Tilletia horrida]KAK0545362.1 mitochondral 37S ribosomal protein S27 [Tilletia horrida]KAK0561305.1 mitochondral 37S ribosomal protein S27 [Tilletia horrida]